VDGIFCRFLMEDLPKPNETLSYMYQVLNPGGWIATCERLNSFSKVYPESNAIEQTWAALYSFFEKEFGKSPAITSELPNLIINAGFNDVQARGFSKIVSRETVGKTFEWYVGIAHGMFESISKDLIEKKVIDKAIIDAAISDYQKVLSSSNSFVLEAAIGISAVRP